MIFHHVNALIRTVDGCISLHRDCGLEITAEHIHIFHHNQPVNTDCALYTRGAVTSIHILGRSNDVAS